MRIAFLALMLSAASGSIHAANNIATDKALSAKAEQIVASLCARLTQKEVATVMGKQFEQQPPKIILSQVCQYGDSKETGKMPVRYFALGYSNLKAEGWRRFVEVDAKGKVIERDGVLVSHFRRDKFRTDVVWFQDKQGKALELRVNAGVTEDQAVALAKAAMD